MTFQMMIDEYYPIGWQRTTGNGTTDASREIGIFIYRCERRALVAATYPREKALTEKLRLFSFQPLDNSL